MLTLLDVQRPDGLVDCDRDEGVVEPPACIPLLHVDQRLGRDSVAFLRHRRQKMRERTAVALVRKTNLDPLAFHQPTLRSGP